MGTTIAVRVGLFILSCVAYGVVWCGLVAHSWIVPPDNDHRHRDHVFPRVRQRHGGRRETSPANDLVDVARRSPDRSTDRSTDAND